MCSSRRAGQMGRGLRVEKIPWEVIEMGWMLEGQM
jgi:hypothetical protein